VKSAPRTGPASIYIAARRGQDDRRAGGERLSRTARTGLAALLLALCAAAGARSEGEAAPASPVETAEAAPPFEIFGVSVPPGQRRQLDWQVSESFTGTSLPVPVQVIHGSAPGKTLCLTAGIHGDELNGVEIVRRAAAGIAPSELRGTVLAAPIVNLHGFQRSSRYMPDRRDLNRFFPGRSSGSSASRIAHAFFGSVIARCDALVDFHTGSFHRTNLPQVRADLQRPDVAELALAFGEEIVLHGSGAAGTLRRAACDAGIPAITYEVGEPMELSEPDIARGAKRIHALLGRLGMRADEEKLARMPEVYVRSRWVRVEDGGIMLAQVEVGDRVRQGDVLATVVNPVSSHSHVLRSPHTGRVIGRAVNQVVIPGFAAFHIGLALPPEASPEAVGPAEETEEPVEESPAPDAEERPE
jgi:predicted deacylase